VNDRDPDRLEAELGRPPIKDRGYYNRLFGWFLRRPGPPPGESVDSGRPGALVAVLFVAAFVAIGAAVLVTHR
jgi:hypothetical protein